MKFISCLQLQKPKKFAYLLGIKIPFKICPRDISDKTKELEMEILIAVRENPRNKFNIISNRYFSIFVFFLKILPSCFSPHRQIRIKWNFPSSNSPKLINLIRDFSMKISTREGESFRNWNFHLNFLLHTPESSSSIIN